MAKRDCYDILGVSKDVSDSDLKKAHRVSAMKCHPDRNPGDSEAEEKFKELSEAYEILADSDKRAAYDRYGHDALEGGMGGPGSGKLDILAMFGDILAELALGAVDLPCSAEVILDT